GTGGAASSTTNVNIGSSNGGTTTVNSGTLVGAVTTQNVFNSTATTVNFAGSATTLAIGNTATAAQTLNLGTASTGASTYNIGTGATAAATIKTVNLGTGGAASSTTNINIGSSNGGTTTVNSGTLVGASATQNLFNTTATTLNFAGAATSLNLGAATGTLTVANPTITGSNATVLNLNGTSPSIVTSSTGTASVFNTNALTGNLFGAATTISIGASTGTTTVNHGLTVAGGTGQSFIVNDGTTSRFTVDSTNGNTVVSGTLGVTGVTTLTDDLAVNGGDLTTSQTTFNLLNATATTLNIGGAATTVELGAATGTTSVNHNLTVDGNTTHDLGSSTLEWKDLYIDGTAKIDTLTVDENATVAGNLTVTGDLTINGTTTNINTTNLVVEDKNVILGDVTTPTNTTADGGGITLKGTTDKTLNWVNATNAWTSSEDFNLVSGKVYEINGTSVLSATSIGSGVTGSSLTSVGTIGRQSPLAGTSRPAELSPQP
ncbi:MAG: hypothetical protein EB101_09305, partial [Chitinophagia bacterium]|nr:hypothetical protein [Chitinophagia bacterium]